MSEDKINSHRSNIKYVLNSLFTALEKQKQERVFKREDFIITYKPESGLILEGKNPKITVDHNGVFLPKEYTSVFQLPYDWFLLLKKDI